MIRCRYLDANHGDVESRHEFTEAPAFINRMLRNGFLAFDISVHKQLSRGSEVTENSDVILTPVPMVG